MRGPHPLLLGSERRAGTPVCRSGSCSGEPCCVTTGLGGPLVGLALLLTCPHSAWPGTLDVACAVILQWGHLSRQSSVRVPWAAGQAGSCPPFSPPGAPSQGLPYAAFLATRGGEAVLIMAQTCVPWIRSTVLPPTDNSRRNYGRHRPSQPPPPQR